MDRIGAEWKGMARHGLSYSLSPIGVDRIGMEGIGVERQGLFFMIYHKGMGWDRNGKDRTGWDMRGKVFILKG